MIYAKKLDPVGITQFLCAGAAKNITDNSGRSLHDMIRHAEDENGVEIYTRFVEATDLIESCLCVLRDYPAKLVKCFEEIDGENTIPTYLTCKWLSLEKINGIDFKNDTAIHRAVRLGEKGDTIVRELIGTRGWFNGYVSGIDGQNDDGDTPLHLVMKTERSIESRQRMCLFLVSRGVDAGIRNKGGVFPVLMDPPFWITLLDYGNSRLLSGGEKGVMAKTLKWIGWNWS